MQTSSSMNSMATDSFVVLVVFKVSKVSSLYDFNNLATVLFAVLKATFFNVCFIHLGVLLDSFLSIGSLSQVELLTVLNLINIQAQSYLHLVLFDEWCQLLKELVKFL